MTTSRSEAFNLRSALLLGALAFAALAGSPHAEPYSGTVGHATSRFVEHAPNAIGKVVAGGRVTAPNTGEGSNPRHVSEYPPRGAWSLGR
jgi:hypothetical protein